MQGTRILGLDVARALALFGMMLTHVWLTTSDGETNPLAGAVEGKASALFAVLAGAGIVLSTRKELAFGRLDRARRMIAARGAVLIVFGLLLGMLPPFVLVILAFYGFGFFLTLPMIGWSAKRLAIIAGCWIIVAPQLSFLVRQALPVAPVASPDLNSLWHPLELLAELLFTGAYPAFVWLAYLVLGMAVAKIVLAAQRRGTLVRCAAWLAGAGALLLLVTLAVWWMFLPRAISALAAEVGDADIAQMLLLENSYGTVDVSKPWLLVSIGAHTGTSFDLGLTAAVALIVIAGCLLAGVWLRGAWRFPVQPLAAAGAVPLTVYALHVSASSLTVGALGYWPDASDAWLTSSAQMWCLHMLGAVAIGEVCALMHRRGPLETVVTMAGRLAAGPRDLPPAPRPSSTA